MKDNVTIIHFRFLKINDDGSLVIKMDEDHKDGYYEFMIYKDELKKVLSSKDKKLSLYEYFAESYDRSFMEFMMLEMGLESSYIASIKIDDTDEEFSYLESKYMDETYLDGGIKDLYSEEFGMLSDFDYYPYGLE